MFALGAGGFMHKQVRLGVLVACATGCAGLEPDTGETAAAVQTGVLEIDQINVGWGSSVLLIGPDGTTVLLEAGNTGMGSSRVVPYLQSLGITPASGLDYTIAGHQHCDHIGGLDEVVAAGYDVRRQNYYNGSSYSSSCVTQWQAAAAGTTAGAQIVPVPGDVIALG